MRVSPMWPGHEFDVIGRDWRIRKPKPVCVALFGMDKPGRYGYARGQWWDVSRGSHPVTDSVLIQKLDAYRAENWELEPQGAMPPSDYNHAACLAAAGMV